LFAVITLTMLAYMHSTYHKAPHHMILTQFPVTSSLLPEGVN